MTRRLVSKTSNDRTTLEYKKECVQKELPYVNYMRTLSVGCPNNMTEICAVNSKDYVMCSGRGSLEERDEQMISTR